MERKFKVGDRVMDEYYGIGTVKFDDESNFYPYAVEFDKETGLSVSHCKNEHGSFCDEGDLTLVEKQNP